MLKHMPRANRIRWAILGLCSGILIALSYRARWGGTIGIPCLAQWLTGIPCPMCGMTRSLTALLQGDLATSMAFHGLGWLTLVGLTAALLIVSLDLGFNRSIEFPGRRQWRSRFSNGETLPTIGMSVASLYVIHHGFRLVPMIQSGEWATRISSSIVGRLLN
jgi:Protein of unknown function (DUF2752)